MIKQPDLFQPDQPPVIGSPELHFTLALADGCEISVCYERRYLLSSDHYEFIGDISSTGYRSHFPGFISKEPDESIIENSKIFAELLRAERLAEIAKEERLKNRKQKKRLIHEQRNR